jgi:ADP-heptose:LPS heptosyltransferase
MQLRHKLAVDYYAGSFLHFLLKPFVVVLGWLLRRDHSLSRCSTVTVLKMMGGGSLVIAYPSLLALKRSPGVHKLNVVVSPAVRPFADTLGIFDQVIVIDDRSPWKLLRTSLRAWKRLFRTDAIIDLEVHSRLTTVFCLLTCARNRVGFYTMESFWRRNLSTHLLFCHVGNGIYHFYDQIAGLFGGTAPGFEDCVQAFRKRVRPPARDAAGARIGVAPCCSDLGKERMLHRQEWVEILVERLREEPPEAALHFLGGPADREYLEKLIGALKARVPGIDAHNHAGETSLSESVRLLGSMDELQCIDSGMLHFARLLGVKTVSYWGPTDPKTRMRPSAASSDTTNYYRLPCSPCVHLTPEAPCRGNNICMRLAVSPGMAASLSPAAWLAMPVPPVAGEDEVNISIPGRSPVA